MLVRSFRTPLPVQLRQSLGPLWIGRLDPTMRLTTDEVVLARRNADGPATLALKVLPDGTLDAGAWGPGAQQALEDAPALVGAGDDLTGFAPEHPFVRRAHHRSPGLRIVACGRVVDHLVATVLAQRVTGMEAARGWRTLTRRFGEPAPGPQGLLLPPRPEVLAALPDHVYAGCGIERSRARTLRAACAHADRLEEAVAMSPGAAHARLTAIAGVGDWTAASVLREVIGDADAVETGDFHLPHQVSWALAREPRGDDARMLALLEPFRGHRGRVVRLVVSAGPRPPAYGPRYAPTDLRGLTDPALRRRGGRW